MPNDPFKPPETDSTPKAATPGSPLRAVLTGLAVDIGGSILAGFVLSLFYHSEFVAAGLTSDQIDAAMSDMPMNSPFALINIVLGSACSVLGGYVCARIVRRHEFRVGAVMATLSAMISLSSATENTPDDLALLLTITTAACVMLGVKFGRERNLRAASPSSPPASPPTGGPRA